MHHAEGSAVTGGGPHPVGSICRIGSLVRHSVAPQSATSAVGRHCIARFRSPSGLWRRPTSRRGQVPGGVASLDVARWSVAAAADGSEPEHRDAAGRAQQEVGDQCRAGDSEDKL